MAEEILPDLYRIEVPLPHSPLKSVNSYLIKAQGRFLLIDTGMNREECMREMLSSLEEMDVDLRRTDFFITHVHADHLGLVARLATGSSKVYFNQKEASLVNAAGSERKNRWQKIYAVYLANGLPEDIIKKSAERHPGHRYSLKSNLSFCTLREGDTIQIGDYSFRCIETPGHSVGHMCLYEANRKILVSGDHILFDITPHLEFWPEMDNPLKEYLASLDKVYALDVNLVLPGHRSIWNDHRKRSRELKEHHQARADEVLSALVEGQKTAFQIAPYVTWDIDCASWELFPPLQKWFAVGETIVHLRYLEAEGRIRREIKENRILFSLA